MNTEEKNTALYQKMESEQDKYRDWLLAQPPEEILSHAYEYTVRQDVLMSLEYNDLTDAQAEALLASPSPLEDVFHAFEKIETGYMDTVLECIMERADTVIHAEQEARKALLALPVYKYPASYAREHDELEAYRASNKANIACKTAIETAIREHYHDNSLSREAVKQVVDQFGYDRTLHILAITVREQDWDGRFSHDNKQWAGTIPVFENPDQWGDNRNREFVVSSHPGLTDMFVTWTRREYLLTLPLTKEDIKKEALRLLSRLQDQRQPNSPSGTHFMAEISPDFLLRAGSKDQDKLFAMLPFQSLNFTGIDGRKGLYAVIQKDEDRTKPLRQRRASVRDKLQKAPAAPKPPATGKKKEMEL